MATHLAGQASRQRIFDQCLITTWRQDGSLMFFMCKGFTTLVENPLAKGLSSKVGGRVVINLRPMAGGLLTPWPPTWLGRPFAREFGDGMEWHARHSIALACKILWSPSCGSAQTMGPYTGSSPCRLPMWICTWSMPRLLTGRPRIADENNWQSEWEGADSFLEQLIGPLNGMGATLVILALVIIVLVIVILLLLLLLLLLPVLILLMLHTSVAPPCLQQFSGAVI
jgi:hypothetical protein